MQISGTSVRKQKQHVKELLREYLYTEQIRKAILVGNWMNYKNFRYKFLATNSNYKCTEI